MREEPIAARTGEVRPWVILTGLVFFSAAFSLFFMSLQGLGLDEAQSMWQAAHSLSGILYVVAQDVHVPLYHFMLHFWMLAFGNGVLAARILSLVFFLPTIPLTYILGRIAFNNKSVGLWAAVFFAFSPFSNWYGSVIRMYSLLALVTVINQIFFLLIYKGSADRRPLYWFGYFMSALVGVYTHYFFFFNFGAQALFFLGYRKDFPKEALKKFLVIAALLVILFLPWLIYVHSVPGGFGAYTEPKLPPPTTVDVFNTVSNFLFGFQSDAVNAIILSLWPLVTLLLFFALQRNKRIPAETVYFATATVAPIIAAALLSYVISPFFLSRYFIGVFPAFCLVAAWIVSVYPKSISIAVKAALIVAMVATLVVQTANAQSPIKEDYKDVGAYLDQNATARDAVAISTPFTIYPVEYYYEGPAQIITIPEWNRLQPGPIPAFSEDQLAQVTTSLAATHDKLWLVLSYDQGYQSQLLSYFDTHYERLSAETFSPGLTVYSYQLRYGPDATMSSTVALAQSMLGTVAAASTTASR